MYVDNTPATYADIRRPVTRPEGIADRQPHTANSQRPTADGAESEPGPGE